MRAISLFLAIFVGFSTVHAAESSVQLAERALNAVDSRHEDPQSLQQLARSLHAEVVAEIEAEAAASGLDRDAYIDRAESFNNFVTELEKIDTETLDRPTILILLIKTGQRLNIQSNVRFEPEGHTERVEKVRRMAGILAAQLGIKFLNPTTQAP